jgi:lipoprotein-releasing system ATP-binding protein
MSDILVARQVCKVFTDGQMVTPVLDCVDLTLAQGESLAILGSSGSGKSTLLHILGGLDQPSSGEVILQGQTLFALKETQRSRLRNSALGFIYQFHHLLAECTALENVMMPLLIRRTPASAARESAQKLLERVGLGHRLAHKPAQLSGGERQRVAIARALVGNPACVLADEPTGNLDSQTAQEVLKLINELKQELKIAFVFVTHDHTLAHQMDRRLFMRDGQLMAEND